MSAQGWGRWQLAKDCTVEHPFGEDGWRAAGPIGQHEHWVNAPDQKYIVFKRADFMRFILRLYALETSNEQVKAAEAMAIYDAVVIRTQDAFASPALHAYAYGIQLAARLIKEHDQVASHKFSNIADYFHFRALEADSGSQKLPDY